VPDIEFFEELKSQFERQMDTKQRLDTKATDVMRISATIATLLVAISIFMFGQLQNYDYLTVALILFGVGFVSFIYSIIGAVLAHVTRDYTYPMGHQVFFDENNELDNNVVNLFRESTDDQFYERMIEEYLFCIRANSIENSFKSRFINQSHRFFLLGIIVLLGLLIIVFHAILISQISFTISASPIIFNVTNPTEAITNFTEIIINSTNNP